MKPVRSALLGAVALLACGCSKTSNAKSTVAPEIDVETMQPHEAAQVVEEFATKYGIETPPPRTTNVASMSEVLRIIQGDRLHEYEAARRFTAGRHGAEALTLRARLELSLAGAMLTTAAILEEQRTQAMTELRQLTGPSAYRIASSTESSNDADRIASLQIRTEDLAKVVHALRMLSEEPLAIGADFAKQAVRHDARSQLAFLARANAYELEGDWLQFDQMMRYADDIGGNPPVKTYLRAMEAWERYADRAKCEDLLRRTLADSPEFVRAQANLVLVNQNVERRYAELQKLEAMSPDHIVVRLAGAMIQSEYQTVEELEGTVKSQ